MKNYKQFILHEKLDLLDDSELNLIQKCLETIRKSYKSGKPFEINQYNEYTIIGFHGTKTLEDISIDLDFSEKDEIHHGFKKYADSLTLNVEKVNKIILTGHSLGAAVAILKFIELKKNQRTKDKIKMLFCFGSPKIGHKAIYKELLDSVSNPEKELHFITLVERTKKYPGHQDPVTLIPKSFDTIDSNLIDFVDLHSLESESMIDKFLGIHLHRLKNYEQSLDAWTSLLHQKIQNHLE